MSGEAPLLLISGGESDVDFYYATRFDLERGVYFRSDREEVLVASRMEAERASATTQVAQVLDAFENGYPFTADTYVNWATVAANLLESRGVTEARASPRLHAGYLRELEARGIKLQIQKDLFVAERRHKSQEEANAIHSAQRAAEAACVEVIGILGTADIRDGKLWSDGRPLTSEHLMAEAQFALAEIGYAPGDLIIAGSPGSAMGHYNGEGQINANAPVVIDIFPRGKRSRYCGDLTRTVVVGEVSEQVTKMHAAVFEALEAAAATVRAGVDAREVQRAAARVLVERGYGTITPGFEGNQQGPIMNHSLGHGVGLEVHEAPTVGDVEFVLEEGDVITLEPGLYLKDLGGIRVEDTGMVTRDGFRNFTSISRSLDPRAYL